MTEDTKKKEKDKTLIERIDEVHFDVPEGSLHSIIEDAMKVTAHISKGTEPKVSSKEIVAGTLDVIHGVKKILKAKDEKEDKE